MKSLFNFFAVSLISIFIFSICGISEEPPKQEKKKLSEEELWNIYYNFIAEVKPYGIPTDRKEHEKTLKPILRIYDKEYIDVIKSGNSTITDYSNSTIVVRIDSFSGEIRSFSFFPEPSGLPFDPNKINDKALMDKADVLSKARKYLKYNTQTKVDSFEEQIEYVYGQWNIFFRRKQGKYLFSQDVISMHYDEKQGLVGYWNGVFSKECKDIIPKITEKQAKESAIEHAQEIIKNEEIFSYRKEDIELKLKSSSIGIINPAYIEMIEESKEHPYEECQKTRLSYIFTFTCDDSPEGSGIKLYIDAITGELIYGHPISWAKS